MSVDRHELMNLAWHLARQELWSRRLPASALRLLFPHALRTAWREMKYRAELAVARAAKPKRPADEIRAEILILENTDRLGFQGIERLSAARAELHEALAAERKAAEEADLAAKRELIASAKGRFCAVTFTKKDGTERTMRVQPAALKFHVAGNAAGDVAQRAVATRAARHPHLLPVEAGGPLDQSRDRLAHRRRRPRTRLRQ